VLRLQVFASTPSFSTYLLLEVLLKPTKAAVVEGMREDRMEYER
jgi:hypothetical protein